MLVKSIGLCAIEVKRTGFKGGKRASNPVPRLGNATWILGVRELKRDPSESQQKRIDRRTKELNERRGKSNQDVKQAALADSTNAWQIMEEAAREGLARRKAKKKA